MRLGGGFLLVRFGVWFGDSPVPGSGTVPFSDMAMSERGTVPKPDTGLSPNRARQLTYHECPKFGDAVWSL